MRADLALAPADRQHERQPSTSDKARTLDAEALIREARDAGYDGSQSKLSRLVRAYLNARTNLTFAAWLGHADPTANTAVRNVMKAGGRYGTA